MSPSNDHRPSEPGSGTPAITAEVLSQWKLEIRDFFAATEQKLNRIRDLSNPPFVPDSNPSDQKSDPTDQERCGKEGSLDRLQLIKHRLAAQLENSRR